MEFRCGYWRGEVDMAKNWKTYGLSCHVINDTDLIQWLESLPSNARAAAMRDMIRAGLRQKGNSTDYSRGTSTASPSPDMSEVRGMFKKLTEMISAATGGQDWVLAQRDGEGHLQEQDLGYSVEEQESLVARIFGGDEDDE